jgi:hypothetical protein
MNTSFTSFAWLLLQNGRCLSPYVLPGHDPPNGPRIARKAAPASRRPCAPTVNRVFGRKILEERDETFSPRPIAMIGETSMPPLVRAEQVLLDRLGVEPPTGLVAPARVSDGRPKRHPVELWRESGVGLGRDCYEEGQASRPRAVHTRPGLGIHTLSPPRALHNPASSHADLPTKPTLSLLSPASMIFPAALAASALALQAIASPVIKREMAEYRDDVEIHESCNTTQRRQLQQALKDTYEVAQVASNCQSHTSPYLRHSVRSLTLHSFPLRHRR